MININIININMININIINIHIININIINVINTGTLFFTGFGLGCMINAAFIVPRFSRITSLKIMHTLQTLGSLSFMANSYPIYLFLRFLTGFGNGATLVVATSYATEFIPGVLRSWTIACGLK